MSAALRSRASAASIVLWAGLGSAGAAVAWWALPRTLQPSDTTPGPQTRAAPTHGVPETPAEAPPAPSPSPALEAPPRRAGVLPGPTLLERADLESPYRHPPLAQAKRAFDRGDALGALAALERERSSLPVRMLRARALARAGADRRAAEVYAGLAADFPRLAPVCAYEAGRGFERSGDLARSAAHYALVPRASERFVAAREGLSRVLERQGDLQRAITAVASLTEPGVVDDADVRARAMLRVAALSRKAGRAADERNALWSLWASEPRRPEAARALARLGKRTPVPVRWALLRAEALATQGATAEAVTLAEATLRRSSLTDSERCRAHLVLGEALRRARRAPEALAAIEPARGLCREGAERLRALAVLAAARLATDDAAGAELAVDALVDEDPRHPLTLRALSQLGFAVARAGRPAAAAEHFARVAAADPQGPHAAEALFQGAWAHRRLGNEAEVRAALEQILALPDEVAALAQRHQARYWLARSLEASARSAEALRHYEQLALEGTNTSYGLFARERLVRAGRPLASGLAFVAGAASVRSVAVGEPTLGGEAVQGPSSVWPLPLGSLAADERFWSGVELARLEHPLGPMELLLVDRRRHGPEGLRALSYVFEALGRPGEARLLARDYVRGWARPPPPDEARRLLAVAYPDAFGALLEGAARSAGVDPALLQALVREESQFNPRARSGVGARGLAQVMPATGAEVARSLGLRLRGPDALFEPALNLRLGAAYLAKLLRRMDGATPLAVASYNAGPNAVARWLAQRPLGELDAWLEDIPVEETRTYVRRVLGSYGLYALRADAGREPPRVLGLEPSERAVARAQVERRAADVAQRAVRAPGAAPLVARRDRALGATARQRGR